MRKFEIGDKVWHAETDYIERWMQCPHCFGKKYLTVILGDDSSVTVECTGCQFGYDPPQGVVRVHEYRINVKPYTITGMETEIKNGVVMTEYKARMSECCYLNLSELDTFATKEEAELRAKELARDRSDQAMKEFYSKDRPTRTWAYNATYHRYCLKQAQRDVAYHQAKLEVALSHKKTEESLK